MEMRESFLLRIAADPPARLWSGVGNLEIPADNVEDDPATYLGAGELLSVPDFQALINGTAQRLEFTVSGVSAETLRLATIDAASVRGAAVHLGRIEFDEFWQPVGPVEWEAVFRADFLSVQNEESEGGRRRSITLSVGYGDTGRSFAPASYFTDADQRMRSPDDKVFDHVAGINSGTSRRFGPKPD